MVKTIVKENIKKYFAEHENLSQYVVKKVFKSREYLYIVVAYNENRDTYTVWSAWNETTQCLNCGYYDIPTYEQAIELTKRWRG
jgi:predicted acetyltransferase